MSREIAPLADIKSFFQLRRVFKKEKPLIVHASTPKASLLSMMAARSAGVPVRMLTPTGFRFVGLSGVKRKIVFFFECLPFRFASHIYPESQGVINTIRKYKMTRKSLSLIGYGSVNGVNLAVFDRKVLDRARLAEIKATMDYREGDTYLLFVGRIVKDKGIEELLSAFSRLPAHIRLIILGPFEAGDPVSPSAADQIKNDPRILHIDWTNEVEYYMALADLLVHPSYREGLPNVLLQAGAMECPVICSRIEGNIDIVDHEVTGLIFPPRDANALLETLQQALASPLQMQVYSRELRQKIVQRYDHNFVCQSVVELYASHSDKAASPTDRRPA